MDVLSYIFLHTHKTLKNTVVNSQAIKTNQSHRWAMKRETWDSEFNLTLTYCISCIGCSIKLDKKIQVAYYS